MISVIIPTYNGSSSILSTVHSVLMQSYSNLEIIIVDDNGAGTDEQLKTEKVLGQLIASEIVKYVVHDNNKNGSAARNTGFKKSNGNLICFLDDDDILLEKKLEKEAAFLEANPLYSAVVCGSYFVHEDGKGKQVIPNWDNDHFERDYLTNILFNTSALLIRRSVIESLGGFDESFQRHQDWEFCLRMAQIGRIGVVPETLLIKYATNRSMASNPKMNWIYYQHFFDKMRSIFETLSNNDYETIIDYNNRRLLKSYIIALDAPGTFRFILRNKMTVGNLIKTIFELTIQVINRVFGLKSALTLPKKHYSDVAEEWIKELMVKQ